MMLLYLILLFICIVVVYYYCNNLKIERHITDKIVIVTSHYNEDLDWLKNANCPVVVCDKEGAEQHSIIKKDKYSCPIIKNRGKEASAYLNFIINNYENLPEYIAFIHGHERSWHQTNDILHKIMGNDYIGKGYYSLGEREFLPNSWHGKEGGYAYWGYFINEWDIVFRPILKRNPPTELKDVCCAQFIVSSERIKKISKEDYNFWLNYLIGNDNDDITSVMFEMMWHVIFGENDYYVGIS